MRKLFSKNGLFLGAGVSAIFILSSCGGGGSSSSSSAPPSTVNQPPTVSAISKLSIVTEGQPFELDASGSTDREGSALTFAWRQTSGPAVDLSSTDQATLNLTAPMIESDQALTFEVDVSDGTQTRTATLSLDVENLKIDEVQSEATEFGTAGPITAVETVGDPSEYEGDKPLVAIRGITPTPSGGYTIHWTHRNGGQDMPVSSQDFLPDGTKTGSQVDGAFDGGITEQYERDGYTFNKVTFGVTFDAVMSGSTLFYANASLEIFDGLWLGLSSHRGPVVGLVEGLGDIYVERRKDYQAFQGYANTAIGSDQLLSIMSTLEDENTVLKVTSYVIDPDGQSRSHILSEAPSAEPPEYFQELTASVYGGDSYVTAWQQDTSETGYDVWMQRANADGNLLGNVETVNLELAGDQVHPQSTTMTDGNVFMAWLDNASETPVLKARIMRPDGTFTADETALEAAIRAFDPTDTNNEFYFKLTALNTNQVLVTWLDDSSQLKASVLDGEFNVVSNPFLIAESTPTENIARLYTQVLPDNRVIMAWLNDYYASGEPSYATSHSAGFYPVGKE